MTRQERIALHKKQERLQVKPGKPEIAELIEGVPVLRSTSEGIVEYIRHNGVLYKKVLDKSTVKTGHKTWDEIQEIIMGYGRAKLKHDIDIDTAQFEEVQRKASKKS